MMFNVPDDVRDGDGGGKVQRPGVEGAEGIRREGWSSSQGEHGAQTVCQETADWMTDD